MKLNSLFLATALTASVSHASNTDLGDGKPWAIPFPGLEDDTSKPWGPTIQHQNGTSERYPIKVNDSAVIDKWREMTAKFTTSINGSPRPRDGFMVIKPNEAHSLILNVNHSIGGNTTINEFKSFIRSSNFVLNLGRSGKWNSSIAWEGYYDANRVFDSDWDSITLPEYAYDDFFSDGRLKLREDLVFQCDRPNCNGAIRGRYNITLDLNSDIISLPSNYSCNKLNAFSIRGPSVGNMIKRVPANITSVPGRCVATGNEVILGKPFLQAVMFGFKGRMLYIAEAHQADLPVKLASIDYAANLTSAVPGFVPLDFLSKSNGQQSAGATVPPGLKLVGTVGAVVALMLSWKHHF